jgi:glutaredoxin
LADFFPHGKIAQAFGVLRPEGYSERALFVIDRRSVIRYVDVHDIDEQPDNEVLFRELAAIEGVPVPQEIIASPAVEEQARSGEEADVVMYCTDWCPSCRQARIYLKTNNISYKEINITRDRLAAQRVRNWTGGFEATPTFDVKGNILVNFDQEKLNRLLGIQG